MVTKLDRRFFPLIFESICQGIFTVNEHGVITSFNMMAELLTGYCREEVIGKECSQIFRTERCESSCPLKTSMSSGGCGKADEVMIITKNGDTIPVAISTAALIDDNNRVIGGVEMFRDLRVENELRRQLHSTYSFEDIVSKNHKMQEIFKLLPLIAQNKSSVLISGESGTGKELIARAIYNLGPRKNKPFVAVNCAAIPDNLLESELFGYKKGAFTDAIKDKEGRFAAADGGTILLDEIGEISESMQVKLLRVLQEREFVPLGSNTTRKIDVRVIASTNKDLEEAIKTKTFRQDFYYRLNVVRLKLPPLRDRREDIPLLVHHFIKKFNQLQRRRIRCCSERVLSALMRYPFPGNIRELENAIEHAFVVCIDKTIQISDLPQHIVDYLFEKANNNNNLKLPLENAEENAIREALLENGNNRSSTAEQLGISRNTLWRKMKKYGIEV